MLPFLLFLGFHVSLTSPAPLPWSVARGQDVQGLPYFHAQNTDKDGSLIAARLAGASQGVSDTRSLTYNITRFADASYQADVAQFTLSLYNSLPPSPLLVMNSHPLVISSVHRVALYTAEALHAPVLPAQTLAFAQSLSQACSATQGGARIVILGCDFGYDGGWLWLKPNTHVGVPPSHLTAMANASSLLLLRATDSDTYLGVVGCKGGSSSGGGGPVAVVVVHSSLRDFASQPSLHPFAAALWAEVVAAGLTPNTTLTDTLHQWEWGLPDATIEAYHRAWVGDLGKDPGAFHALEGGVVDGYAAVPALWTAYLGAQGLQPRGVSIQSYWTAFPALDRADAVIPFPAYAFFKPDWHPLADLALTALEGIVAAAPGGNIAAVRNHTRAFINTVGSSTETQGVAFLANGALGGGEFGLCVLGLDCEPGAPASTQCFNASAPVPPAHVQAAQALGGISGGKDPLQFIPLTLQQAMAALAPWKEAAAVWRQ